MRGRPGEGLGGERRAGLCRGQVAEPGCKLQLLAWPGAICEAEPKPQVLTCPGVELGVLKPNRPEEQVDT